MRSLARIALVAVMLVPASLLPWPPLAAEDCSTNCQVCDHGVGLYTSQCAPGQVDAWCECHVIMSGGGCGFNGQCVPGPVGGGGGGGGTGGGGGGGSCSIRPGQWCPAECGSCDMIYF